MYCNTCQLVPITTADTELRSSDRGNTLGYVCNPSLMEKGNILWGLQWVVFCYRMARANVSDLADRGSTVCV